MDSKPKCIYCNRPLKAFTAQPDWIVRKMHKKCYIESEKYSQLRDFTDRMNEMFNTRVPYPTPPTQCIQQTHSTK